MVAATSTMADSMAWYARCAGSALAFHGEEGVVVTLRPHLVLQTQPTHLALCEENTFRVPEALASFGVHGRIVNEVERNVNRKVAHAEGLEPPTLCSEDRCSDSN